MNGAEFAKWAPRVLSLLRIVAGLMFLQHGLSKYFGWPGQAPGNFHVISIIGLAGAIEIVGGALLAVGFFTRIVAFVMSGEMAFAYFMAHAGRSFFPLVNQGELAVLYCFVFLYIAVAGGGPWGMDGARRR